MSLADFQAANPGGFAQGAGRNLAGQYGTTFDRSGWDALFMALTGAPPGRASVATANALLDPAIHRAADRVKDMLAADTPVDTGLMKQSWEEVQEAPGRWRVENDVVSPEGKHYAALVEGRAPGGPAKYHGAMIAQNLARIETVVAEEVEAEMLLLGGIR